MKYKSDELAQALIESRSINEEDRWITIKGTHVQVDGDGTIKNKKLRDKIESTSKASKLKSTKGSNKKAKSAYSEAIKKPTYKIADKIEEIVNDIEDLTDDFRFQDDPRDPQFEVCKAKRSFVDKIDKAVRGSYGNDKFQERFGNLSKDTISDIEDELSDTNDEEAKKAWETVKGYRSKLEDSINDYINQDHGAPKFEGYNLDNALGDLCSDPSKELGIDFDEVAKSFKIMDEFCTKNKVRLHTR